MGARGWNFLLAVQPKGEKKSVRNHNASTKNK
jgi:hypothetical protein